MKDRIGRALVVVQQRDAPGVALRQQRFDYRCQWRDPAAAADQEQFVRRLVRQRKVALRWR
jgi:hypothetical protein